MALSMKGVNISGKTSMGQIPAPGFRYFRVNITSYAGVAVRFQAVNIMVGGTVYPTTPMDGPASPGSHVATQSSYYSYYQAWYAFANLVGGNDSYRWIAQVSQPTPQWIQLDLGVGNEITPTALKLCPDSAGGTDYPTYFYFLGSNTGSFAGEETILYDSGALTGANWTANAFTTFTF